MVQSALPRCALWSGLAILATVVAVGAQESPRRTAEGVLAGSGVGSMTSRAAVGQARGEVTGSVTGNSAGTLNRAESLPRCWGIDQRGRRIRVSC